MKKDFVPIILTFVISAISTSAFPQWVRKADALKTRSEVASVVYGGKLYAFLGFGNSALQAEPSVEVYDPALDTWTLLSPIPAGKSVTHQGVVLVDDNVWHIGGRVGPHPGPLTSETWIYNISSDSWSAGPQIIDPATGGPLLWGGGGAALLGRTLHLFGGFVINACNNDQGDYHLTLNIDDWLANRSVAAPWKNERVPLPNKRNHISAAVLGGKIYAIGGQFGHDCGGGEDKQFSHAYDPVTNTWTELPLLPTPRSHAEGGLFVMDGKIFLVAGQGTGGASTNKVTIFDPSANSGNGSWSDDNELILPSGYEGISAKVIENTFIISHGGEGFSANPRNTCFSRSILRNPVYELGFSSGCANVNVPLGNVIKTNTFLFTVDGSKNYTTSSSAEWLSVSKGAIGTAIPNAIEMELTINTSGLAPGFYNAVVTATGTGEGPAYTAASYCVNVTVSEEGALPLTWLYFRGQEGTDGVKLTWATANEINTTSFIIERSLNGTEFVNIASVSSSATGKYGYTDIDAPKLNSDVLYYRLRQVDQNGKYSFSPLESISLKARHNQPFVRALPNPFTSTLVLQISNTNKIDIKDKVELYSSEGKLLYRRNLGNRINNAPITLDDLPALKPGVYMLNTFVSGRLASTKVIHK